MKVKILNSLVLPTPLGKAVIQRSNDCFFYHGMAYRPVILVRRIFELLCKVETERLLKAPQRRFSVDFGLCFLKDFQAILYDELDGPLREVVHLFGADAKERLPTELFDTLQPRLLPRKKFGRVSPIQKFIQRKLRPPGVAKMPIRFH